MKTQKTNNLATQFQKAQTRGAIQAKFDHGEITREEYERLMTEHGFEFEEEVEP